MTNSMVSSMILSDLINEGKSPLLKSMIQVEKP